MHQVQHWLLAGHAPVAVAPVKCGPFRHLAQRAPSSEQLRQRFLEWCVAAPRLRRVSLTAITTTFGQKQTRMQQSQKDTSSEVFVVF